MSNRKKESQKGFSNLNRVIILQLVIMLGLSLFITYSVSNRTKQNSIEHMGAITDERAHLIKNYVVNAEKTLKAYSKAEQITELLEAPDDSDITAKAQKYTEYYGMDVSDLEGIYASKWDTTTLVHSSQKSSIGRHTREGTRLEQLQNSMLEMGDEVYDTGIIISPASGKQIVSMYKAIYDDNKQPIGLVGLGIYTEGLIKTLDDIPIRGVEQSFYSMVNVQDYNYIFNVDSSMIGKAVSDTQIKDLCDQYRGTKEEVTGSFEYKKDGKSYISIYTYMPEYGWILMIDDDTSEVFALTRTMNIYLGLFGVIILGLVVVFNIISRRQEKINQKLVSTIAKNNQNKKSLNTAMFKDVLTTAGNRISFAVDVDKLGISTKDSCYFVIFNISNFSDINVRYGNDAGDRLLVQTVDKLYEVFEGADVYRTGSDEFVVVKKSMGGTLNSSEIRDLVDKALAKLTIPVDMGNDMIAPRYKAAIARRSSKADTSVISVLKELTNRAGDAKIGSIDYIEM